MPEICMVTRIRGTGLHGEDVAHFRHSALSQTGISASERLPNLRSVAPPRAGESAIRGETGPLPYGFPGDDPRPHPLAASEARHVALWTGWAQGRGA